jgi:hypothetical protein
MEINQEAAKILTDDPMEEVVRMLRDDPLTQRVFKTFSGQAGYMASKAGRALDSILSKEFLSNSVIHGGFRGAALGVGAGIMTSSIHRWLNPEGTIDNGVINGVSALAIGAGIGAIGGIGAAAANGVLGNIQKNFSSSISKEAFKIGREGDIGAKALSMASRSLGSKVLMGGVALGASAYIGNKILKSIISTNLTRPVDGTTATNSSLHPLVHLI